MKALSLASAFLLATTLSAHAAGPVNNVQDLYGSCKSSGWQYIHCLAYISGVADTLIEIGSLSKEFTGQTRVVLAGFGICPGDATYGAAVQVFINWAAKHPEQWTSVAADGVYGALRETWPCKPS